MTYIALGIAITAAIAVIVIISLPKKKIE